MAPIAKDTIFLRFVDYFFKVCGVSTISYNSNATSGGKKVNSHFARSKLGILYNSFLTCVALASSYVIVEQAYFTDFAARVKFEKVFDTVHSVFTIFAAIFVLLLYCVRQAKIAELAERLREVGEATLVLARKRASLVRSLKMVFVPYLAAASVYALTTPTTSCMLLLYFVSMTICNCVTNALLLQYSACLILVRHAFRIVNEDLLKTIKESSKRSDNATTELSVHGFHLNLVKSSRTQLSVSRLVRSRMDYKCLSKVSRELSDFYSLPMLVCVSHVFLQLIVYSYYIMKPIVVTEHDLTNIDVIHCVCQVLLTVLTLSVLTRSATKAIAESKVSGEIVNDCVVCVADQQIAGQLHQFSSYLLHKSLEFTVYNLFPIDETLLISITSCITTYLVILLQFKESSST